MTELKEREYAPFQQRVICEKKELDTKLIALEAFIDNGEFYAALAQDEKDRLRKQRGFMEGYSIVLTERINAF